ncbi:cell division protein FtsK [Microbacterium sp. SSW1-49]|uniref:Cell division protein FtsK n=1 Tax=Microbacterium croceum TaxID=2851645 RepID=A0ABT0FFE8_9MICO|nr:FtsK/SpoIIIE domain-containing protein [Microbacterium croceum]MCK2036451.1 cell division protein FtsK [Microbacterium croceum]
MDAPPIVLPSAPASVRRAPLPFAAAIIPVAAGVVLWLVSGSLYALCFAALGPLMLAASAFDAARIRRRDRRRDEAESAAVWASAEEDLSSRQQAERAALWHRHPDVARCLAQPPLRGTDAPGIATEVVIGSGPVPSAVRCSGGTGQRAREFQRRCGILTEAPVRVKLGAGICVRGCAPQSAAVARALVAQLCLRFSPAQLVLLGDHLEENGLSALPHARSARRGGLRLGFLMAGDARVPLDAAVWAVPPGAEVPEGITTVIDVTEPSRAMVRTPEGSHDISLEALSVDQVVQLGHDSGEDIEDSCGVPAFVALHDLEQGRGETGLPAVIGRSAQEDVVIDIVTDGPHAIVTGTTGTGKSELLVTWVTAMATAHGPDRVSFVLADFKGGTAFEPLRELRQVAAVITDLDQEGARRGVSSLTAEIRRRESVLAAAGARDAGEISMPRLVIVIDEFAALIQEHPDLGQVFTDVAARGRALGMHLILGTQRASGVVRDALAANCPLRLSLRVADAADSRLVIGTTDAAELPGGAESRGLGFVRRPQDLGPQIVRMARAAAADVSRVASDWRTATRPRSPWRPALPALLPLDELRPEAVALTDALVLGRADVPEQQSQPLESLRPGIDRGLAILGAAASGRTSVLRLLAAQHPQAVWMPGDLEAAWDVISSWRDGSVALPSVVLCDDLDRLAGAWPPEYAHEWLNRVEQLLGTAHETMFVITATRVAGGVGRLLEALPRRALLRMTSRVEHLAAGGEASGFRRDRPPGRARIDDREVQLAWVDAVAPVASVSTTPRWRPGEQGSAVVSAAPVRVVERLQADYPEHDVLLLEPGVRAERSGAILVADAETWQRNPSVWRQRRAEGEVLFRAEHPVELRQLAGLRDLPPYAHARSGRAWSVRGEEAVRRVILPSFAPTNRQTVGQAADETADETSGPATAQLTRRQRRADREAGTSGL